MSITHALIRPTPLSTIALGIAAPLLFSLLGLTLTAAILPNLSDEMIDLIFTAMSFG